jgi:Zn-finger nucleic acid-binding protein
MESCGEVFEQLELKYCERCGGLWLRAKGDEEVYCPECVPKMEEFPQPRRRPRIMVVAVNSLEELETYIAELTGLPVEGGHA